MMRQKNIKRAPGGLADQREERSVLGVEPTSMPKSHSLMTDGLDAEDEIQFNEALRLRRAGDPKQAIAILSDVRDRNPRKAPVVGMLAAIQYEVGDFASAARNARIAIDLSSKSELASRTLFHALFAVGDAAAAFCEVARFRSLRQSDEFERILVEMEADTLRDLQDKPSDPFLNELLGHLRKEMNARPVRQ
jgi:predicted Zn-dependent protease